MNSSALYCILEQGIHRGEMVIPVLHFYYSNYFWEVPKNRVFWLKLLTGARYKEKKTHFEISVKLRIF
jgi:hypothetical protein